MNTATEEAANAVSDWAGKAKKKTGTSGAVIGRNRRQMLDMLRTGDWSDARVGHLLALYAHCHNAVYKVEAIDFKGFSYEAALLTAGRVVKKEFDGSILAAKAFIIWTWKRERARIVAASKAEKVHTFRIGPQWQWDARLITDYRIDKVQRTGLTT